VKNEGGVGNFEVRQIFRSGEKNVRKCSLGFKAWHPKLVCRFRGDPLRDGWDPLCRILGPKPIKKMYCDKKHGCRRQRLSAWRLTTANWPLMSKISIIYHDSKQRMGLERRNQFRHTTCSMSSGIFGPQRVLAAWLLFLVGSVWVSSAATLGLVYNILLEHIPRDRQTDKRQTEKTVAIRQFSFYLVGARQTSIGCTQSLRTRKVSIEVASITLAFQPTVNFQMAASNSVSNIYICFLLFSHVAVNIFSNFIVTS